jgi:60 kDa SS-A/Ro ribonucleoprotein
MTGRKGENPMATNYAQHLTKRATPQREQARNDQVQNSAGGYSFAVTHWQRLERFLILGCEQGSYYAKERELTIENAKCVQACLDEDGARTVQLIVEISQQGRAPKNGPAIFALALAAGHSNIETRKVALQAMPLVCRTGTHLFNFARDVENFRRWGRGLRRAVSSWYNNMPIEKVAYQVSKYRQRDGWSHRDLLRLAHPTGPTPQHNATYRWVVSGNSDGLNSATKKGKTPLISELPPQLLAFDRLQAATKEAEVVNLIRTYKFTHEMLPTKWKNCTKVWEALLPGMPIHAMVRNLAKMTAIGLLNSLTPECKYVIEALTNAQRIQAARLHPLAILAATKVYEQGHGEKGSLSWKPVRTIVDALNTAFYEAFKGIEPTKKNFLLGIDVSGSMTWGTLSGMPGITPAIGSAVMAMATARVESNWHVMGFSSKLIPINISPKQELKKIIETIGKVPMGGTDCALPMIYALKYKIPVDAFVVYTDNETWHGAIHPFQALREYREAMGIPAKLVVVGMIANAFTIADPSDAGMLDMVGFDTSAPAIISDFVRN